MHPIRNKIIGTPLVNYGLGGAPATAPMAGLHLVNRVGEVEDIAEMVYTVAKSNYINGAIINVDGGMGAGYNLN